MLEVHDNTNEVFEGVEKRIEIVFTNELIFVSSLRSMLKEDITDILDAAKCAVLVKNTCESFDAYILSESSLFIFDYKLIILTCGTTSLLLSIPVILEKAHLLGLSYCACQFTRGDYLFPDKQYYPHTSFDEECNYLNEHLPKLEHKFIYNNSNRLHAFANSKYIWRSHQNKDDIIKFYKTVYFNITLGVDYINDIRNVLSKYTDSYDDYKFTPCGYSLNAYKNNGYITIHITPQSNCSYVSIETYNIDEVNTSLFNEKLYDIFHYKPSKIVCDDTYNEYKKDALYVKNKVILVKSY